MWTQVPKSHLLAVLCAPLLIMALWWSGFSRENQRGCVCAHVCASVCVCAHVHLCVSVCVLMCLCVCVRVRGNYRGLAVPKSAVRPAAGAPGGLAFLCPENRPGRERTVGRG